MPNKQGYHYIMAHIRLLFLLVTVMQFQSIIVIHTIRTPPKLKDLIMALPV
jgi:hypothetical protein